MVRRDGEDEEAFYARNRLPDRTYASKSFPLRRTNSPDDGLPARFIYKVFDSEEESIAVPVDGTQWVVSETPSGRVQIKVLIARSPGNVKELWIQRIPTTGRGNVTHALNLRGPAIGRLLDLLNVIDAISPEGETSVRVDDSLIRDLFQSPEALVSMYQKEPGVLRQLIEDDATSEDVIALAWRRKAVEQFRSMLNDPMHFDALASTVDFQEKVWQGFFEENPWILGVSLASQLLTSWDDERLEQVVAGHSVTGPGKKTDALMRTAGRIRSMVFVEIKTHRTQLLSTEYRRGCWSPSREVIGGIAQSQGTVHRAVASIGDRIVGKTLDGGEIPNDYTYLIRPRSILLVGELGQLRGTAGGDHKEKIRSFELFRRSILEPEVITFDELLARAEFMVESVAVERGTMG